MTFIKFYQSIITSFEIDFHELFSVKAAQIILSFFDCN